MWEKFKSFLKRKDIEVSVKRYGIDALGAMAQGLFCSLLIGTILNTLGTQLHIGFLTNTVATVSGVNYTVGGLASAMSGPAMAVAIGSSPAYKILIPVNRCRHFIVGCTEQPLSFYIKEVIEKVDELLSVS